ncbi:MULTISPECIES: YidC/Oxa1 family membrane protein insertase [unclassified Enterococcus]|uniref:YidC/Oxa1 family membrane protein insertase n=1 Tax=unclassified Enterococcus TaxID=2608891 RepID=UPI0024759C68|nr:MULTISPECIES: YidC/Oxa1 family membrane protein insertase [unclassified Enterococcus]
MFSMLSLVVVLSACGTGEVTQSSTGFWDRYIVYYFGEAIKALSFGNMGVGIILFTIVVKVILMPLSHFQTQTSRRMQEIQPQLKELQTKYAATDANTRAKLVEGQQKLYADNNVKMMWMWIPLIAQMPILMALWQAISRVPELKEGQFLWLNLSLPDPYFILPVLAAVFTFASTYLSSMSQANSGGATRIMNFVMPVMIFAMAVNAASGLSLYWVVSNGFQVVQTLLINNPFKIRREREAIAQAEKERQKALQKAMNPKKKRNKR